MTDCMFLRRGYGKHDSGTITLIPSSWSNTRGTVYNGNNALSNTSSSTYAEFSNTSGQWAYLRLEFDTSFLPDNAEITNVVWKIKARRSGSDVNADARPYTKGLSTEYYPYGSQTLPQNINTLLTFSGKSFTAAQLKACSMVVELYASESYDYAQIYGAELTFTYSY
jgi:hypothetical protein